MGKLVKRSQRRAYYGVPAAESGTTTYTRMTKFTSLSKSKNPKTYSRQYVDEDAAIEDVVGYAESISYAFDEEMGNTVHADIANIADEEQLGEDAVREIIVVFLDQEGETSGSKRAVKRSYAVIPNGEGDKVEAQIKFGWEVDAYPVNEIAESVAAVSESDTNVLVDEYYEKYDILLEGRDPEEFRRHVAVQAQIELGFERFLDEKNYQAIVTHFGDLGALKQLPGLAIQRLMQKGYGFGAEGDWKTAAMVRIMKIMTEGMKDAKGTSMLEDYTYNFVPGKEGILQAHMLEICPSIADGPISIKVNPLSMGDREDPARLVFTSKEGKGIATSLIDLGDRFRLIINTVDCKKNEKPMPKLPVATNFWTPEPDLATGAEAWILCGGAHHTAFSYDITAEQMGDWAAMMGIEAVYIDKDTTIRNLKNELRWNELAFRK